MTKKEQQLKNIKKLAIKGGDDKDLLLLNIVHETEDKLTSAIIKVRDDVKENILSVKQSIPQIPPIQEIDYNKVKDEVLKDILVPKDGNPGEKGDRGERGEMGEPGKDGRDGKNGKDGKDGKPGKDGRDGKDVPTKDIEEVKAKITEVERGLNKKITQLPIPSSPRIRAKINGVLQSSPLESINFGAGLSVSSSGYDYKVDATAISDSDKVSVTSADTTPGYLNDKIKADTGISITKENAGANEDLKIANTAPDQTVVINPGTNITSVTGTYPNFTINAATQSTPNTDTLDTVTTRGATTTNAITVGNVTDSGLTASKVVFTDSTQKLTSTGIGTSSQFIKGDGSLDGSTYLTDISGQDLSTADNSTSAFITLGDIPAGLWTDNLDGTISPNPITNRVLIGGATDDTTSALQVAGNTAIDSGALIIGASGGDDGSGAQLQTPLLSVTDDDVGVTSAGFGTWLAPNSPKDGFFIQGGNREMDMYVDGSRAFMFGYDANPRRGLVYNDNLGGGLAFYDEKGGGEGGLGIGKLGDDTLFSKELQIPYNAGAWGQVNILNKLLVANLIDNGSGAVLQVTGNTSTSENNYASGFFTQSSAGAQNGAGFSYYSDERAMFKSVNENSNYIGVTLGAGYSFGGSPSADGAPVAVVFAENLNGAGQGDVSLLLTSDTEGGEVIFGYNGGYNGKFANPRAYGNTQGVSGLLLGSLDYNGSDAILQLTGSMTLSPQGVPTSPIEGQIYYDSTAYHFYGYTNAGWKQLDN